MYRVGTLVVQGWSAGLCALVLVKVIKTGLNLFAAKGKLQGLQMKLQQL